MPHSPESSYSNSSYRPFAILGLAVIEWLVALALGLSLLLFIVQGLGCLQARSIAGYCLR